MRKNLLLITLMLLSVYSYSQVQLSWTKTYNHGTNFKDYATVTAVDPSGNIVVCGVNFDDVYENGSLITTIKYTKEGVELWRRTYGGGEINFSINPVGIAISANGDIHILTQNATFNHVYTVLKYAANGTFRWLDRYAGADGYIRGRMSDIKIDIAGNVYITGYSFLATVGSDFNVDSRYITAKYDADGARLWVKTYNGAAPGLGQNKARGLVVDGSGNVYVTGGSQLNGQIDYATVKYSPAGTELWVQRYTSAGNHNDHAFDIGLDANNNVYVTGKTSLDESVADFTTIKYTSAGDIVWTKTYGTPTFTGYDRKVLLKVDAGGNVIIGASEFAGGNDFGDINYLVYKYNNNGDLVWANRYAGPDMRADEISAMDLDYINNVYVTGVSGTAIATVRFNASNGALHWSERFTPRATGESLPFIPVSTVIGIDIDLLGNVYVAGNYDPASPDPADFVTLKYSQCNIVCPSNITVNAESGKCDAVVTFADVTFTGDCGPTLTYSHPSGARFPVGVTTVTVTSDATGASCSFTITVTDNQNPVITNCPANKTVKTDPGVCYATAGSVNAGTASASDNCNPVGVTGVRSDGASLSANYPVGVTTIVWTATDPSGNTATCSQTITVVDDVPPTVSGETSSTYVLSPPNHTMRDVTINYTATDNCAVTTTVSVESNEPINGVGDGDTDPDYVVLDNVPGSAGQYVSHLQLRAERAAGGTGRIYTVTITATDPYGNTTIKTIDIQVPHDIKKPHGGQAFKVGTTVSFEGEFWDKPGNTHTAKWMIDGSTTVKAAVTEPYGNRNGKITGSYKFTTPGVYKLQMNVTDQNGINHYATTAGDIEAIVVIYDPNGGHTYGGGYFNSPAGALKSHPSATGKASYGFAMNYFKNSTYPKGETQFEFKVGSFEFNALNFEYLAINNSTAQFKGTGKIIGGQSGVAFTMTVVDGELDGTGLDKIRMKIYNKNNGQVIYDNQPGASDAALPAQAVGANSVIVIGGGAKSSSAVITEQSIVRLENNLLIDKLDVGAFPNPHQGTFSLRVQSPVAGKMTIEYFTMTGARIYNIEQQVKAYEQILFPNTGLKFSGTIFYKVSIDGIIKTGKIIGIN
jgi:hypothetical protein